jgi:hypothetical protein
MREKIVRNNQKTMEDARKNYDQNGHLVSAVDQVLYNEFTLLQLCKLKLDFISILCLKKEHLQANFDDQTKIEIRRFEE